MTRDICVKHSQVLVGLQGRFLMGIKYRVVKRSHWGGQLTPGLNSFHWQIYVANLCVKHSQVLVQVQGLEVRFFDGN